MSTSSQLTDNQQYEELHSTLSHDAKVKAFNDMFSKLKDNLEQTIDTVASKLWSKEVIDGSVHDQIFDNSYKGAATRCQYFMKRIYERIKESETEDPSRKKAREIIKTLADVVGEDRALAGVADTIGSCETSADFRRKTGDICPVIEGSNLLDIASKMFARSIITYAEYDIISDPSAEHSETITVAVLKAVKRAIVNDPSAFDDLKGVLVDMGKPISNLALELDEAKVYHATEHMDTT